MSYCRCGDDSDLYIYRSSLGYSVCPHVKIGLETMFFEELSDLLLYVTNLKKLGVKVPDRVFERIENENNILRRSNVKK